MVTVSSCYCSINRWDTNDNRYKSIICDEDAYRLSGLRAQLAKELIEKYGLTMAEAARQLGVTTSAISRICERNK